MEIEDAIEHKSYRGFNLVHLRQGKAAQTRWHITRKESGMNSNYGFFALEEQAHSAIDELISNGSRGNSR